MSTKHPLVGKKLVTANPQRGEVTKKQITDTLEKVVFEQHGSWLATLGAGADQRWTVTVDGTQTITDVRRN